MHWNLESVLFGGELCYRVLRMKVTLEVELPDLLVDDLPANGADLASVFALGLDRWQKAPPQYPWLGEVLEKLAQLPSPQEVLDWKLSPAAQARIDQLLEKNREAGLTESERQEWQCFEQIEHVARLAKTRARSRLKAAA